MSAEIANSRASSIASQINPNSTKLSNTSIDNDNDVLIISYSRTPIGTYNGSLSSLSAVQLAAHTIKHTVKQSAIPSYMIEECIIGNVLSANLGQAPARQAALLGDLPVTTVCSTINKVCASGMHALKLGAQQIQLSQRDIVLVGGCESMSNTPFYTPRTLPKLGNTQLIDGMQYDGLFDPYSLSAMGVSAELCAQKYNITREQQDQYAIQSYQRAQYASNNGLFNNEIVPIQVKHKGKLITVTHDDGPNKIDVKRIPQLKPSFHTKPSKIPQFISLPAHLSNDTHNPYSNNNTVNTGTATAGNSSQISDGAASLLLISRSKARELGLLNNVNDILIIRSYSDSETNPLSFPVSPSLAIPIALQRAGIKKSQIDYWEINEAFATVVLANQQILDISNDRVNVNGGGVSLGHPIGCSGARIIVTLCNILRSNNGRYGCAAICNGGGGSSCVVIERQVV